MIRVEARNHEDSPKEWDLIAIFENWQQAEIRACTEKNENYYLRTVRTGKRRKVIWTNH